MFNCVQKYPPKTRILPKIVPVPNSQVQMFDGAPISGHLPHYGWIKLSRSRPFFFHPDRKRRTTFQPHMLCWQKIYSKRGTSQCPLHHVALEREE